jgi:RNA polymerase sigma-70 factor, ECF subfamily
MKDTREEFKYCYNKYVRPIYRFVLLKVESDDIAKDIVSQTFLKGWDVFQAGEIKNPRALLYRIARNLVIDHYRQRGENVSLDSVSLTDNKNIARTAEINSDMDLVKKAIKNLNENYQNMIIWRYIDELSLTEISNLTSKSETATRVTLHRAMKALQQEIKRYEV